MTLSQSTRWLPFQEEATAKAPDERDSNCGAVMAVHSGSISRLYCILASEQ